MHRGLLCGPWQPMQRLRAAGARAFAAAEGAWAVWPHTNRGLGCTDVSSASPSLLLLARGLALPHLFPQQPPPADGVYKGLEGRPFPGAGGPMPLTRGADSFDGLVCTRA